MNNRPESEVGVFVSDGCKLSYRLSPPSFEASVKVPGIILIHGASTAKGKGRVLFEVFQDELAKNGFSSIAFDTRGVGDSHGEYFDSTLQNRLRDSMGAYRKFIEQDFVDLNRISLLGVSMGGHVAANLAGEHPKWFDKVILINPAAYGVDAEDKRLKPYTEFTQTIRRDRNYEGSSAFSALRRFPGSVLIFRSEFDQVVPEEVVYNYTLASDGRATKIVIPGTPHIFLSGTDGVSEVARQLLYKETVDFLKS